MPATRSTPVGKRLLDGYSTKIGLTNDADISFWEKTVQPPGLDGGDKIPSTTMHNTAVRTFAARSLYEMTDSALTVAYDPAVLTQIKSQINVNQLITVHFPDGDKWDFYGYLKSFEPQDHEPGSPPEAEIVIVATNETPGGTESAPTLSAGGTGTS